MQAVFDAPMTAHQSQQPLRRGVLGRKVGDSIDDALPSLTAFLVPSLSLDSEDLSNARPIQIAVERGRSGQTSPLNSSVTDILCFGGVFGFLQQRRVENESNIRQERWLIFLDRHHRVPAALDDDFRVLAVGVKGIHGPNAPCQASWMKEAVQQRFKSRDFMGPVFSIARNRFLMETDSETMT